MKSAALRSLTVLLFILAGVAVCDLRGKDIQLTGTVQNSTGVGLGGTLTHFLQQSTRTRTTVVANSEGRFTANLPPGVFMVTAEARGYVTGSRQISLAGEEGQTVNFVLLPLKDPLALEAQVNGSELFSAIPAHERREFAHRCAGCHSLEVAGGLRLSRQQWDDIVQKMSGQHPVMKGILGPFLSWKRATWDETMEKLVAFFGSKSGHLDYPTYPIKNDLEHLSKVVITEFELSRPEIYTHDVAAEVSGDRIWYGDQAADRIDAVGKFGWYDPATGKSKEYEVPPCRGFTRAFTDLRTGKIWVGCDYAVASWDPKTDRTEIFPMDLGEQAMHGLAFDSKGNVWLPLVSKTGHAGDDEFDYIARFDPLTSEVIKYKIPTPLAGPYEIGVDSKDNVWFTEIIADKIGKLDPKTGQFSEYPTPTPDSAPRRFAIDSQDNIWFVEFLVGKLAMLDAKKGTIFEYDIPTPFSFPYACSVDRNDIVWFSEITGNRIGRFDPKTKTFREYPIPSRLSGIKKLDFTYAEDKEIVWGGYRVGAKIVRFEIPKD